MTLTNLPPEYLAAALFGSITLLLVGTLVWMTRQFFRALSDGSLVTRREVRDRDAELTRLRAAIDVQRQSDADTLAEVARYLHALVEARPAKSGGQ